MTVVTFCSALRIRSPSFPAALKVTPPSEVAVEAAVAAGPPRTEAACLLQRAVDAVVLEVELRAVGEIVGQGDLGDNGVDPHLQR